MTENSGQGTNTCPKCGAQFPAVGARFCPACGQNLSATEARAWTAPIAPAVPIAPAAPTSQPTPPPAPPAPAAAYPPPPPPPLQGMTGANVLEIAGAAGNDAAIDRAKGFRNKMGDCGITIAASRDAQWDQTMAYDATALYLKSNKDIQGVLAHNDDMALGAIKAIKAAGLKPGTDIKVVSFDATADGFKALISGDLGADIECSPDIAPQAYKAAWDALHGVTAISSWLPTQEGQFFASQGPSALQPILAMRKY